MGLSTSHSVTRGDTVKEVVKFLNEFSSLMSNPVEAKKTISELLSLSEQETAKAQEARDYIARHAALLEDIHALQAKAETTLAMAEKRNKEAADRERDNAQELKRLAAYKTSLQLLSSSQEQKDKENKIFAEKTSMKQAELEAWEGRLRLREGELNKKHDDIKSHAEELRLKAKKLREHAESF